MSTSSVGRCFHLGTAHSAPVDCMLCEDVEKWLWGARNPVSVWASPIAAASRSRGSAVKAHDAWP